jgi:hypothetical protein
MGTKKEAPDPDVVRPVVDPSGPGPLGDAGPLKCWAAPAAELATIGGRAPMGSIEPCEPPSPLLERRSTPVVPAISVASRFSPALGESPSQAPASSSLRAGAWWSGRFWGWGRGAIAAGDVGASPGSAGSTAFSAEATRSIARAWASSLNRFTPLATCATGLAIFSGSGAAAAASEVISRVLELPSPALATRPETGWSPATPAVTSETARAASEAGLDGVGAGGGAAVAASSTTGATSGASAAGSGATSATSLGAAAAPVACWGT